MAQGKTTKSTATPTAPNTPTSAASSRTKKTEASAVRTVAPMIPLAMALLHSAVIAPGNGAGPTASVGPTTTIAAVKCGEGIEDFRACHTAYPTGCTQSGSIYDPYLNLMKNQTTWASMQPEQVFTSLQEIQ